MRLDGSSKVALKEIDMTALEEDEEAGLSIRAIGA